MQTFTLLLCLTVSFVWGIPPQNETDFQIVYTSWQVSIDIYSDAASWACIGVVISDKWILTAAHCFDDSVLFISVGGDGELFEYDYIHGPGYNSRTLFNDIALIELEDPLNVATIALDSEVLEPGTEVIVGDQTNSGTTLYTIENSDCNKLYGQGTIASTMVCANLKSGYSEIPCFGDAGGSLVVNRDGNHLLVGITSFFGYSGCGKYPSVYTRIADYLDWIKDTTGI